MLFKTSNKLVEFAQLSAGIDFNAVKATIARVEDTHILPLLGNEQYDALNNAYTAADAETDLSAPLQALLLQCRKVIGPYVCVYHAPKADVQLSDGGMRRNETANAKTAYQYQGKNFIEANQLEADAETENLISFLEVKKADYPLWVASANFAEYRSLFIKTGAEFNKLFTTHSPHRNYWAVRSKMIDVEETGIRSFLGDDLFNALKTKDKAGTAYTDLEATLVFKIKKAIAAFTLAVAIPFLNVRISSNGLTIVSTGTFTTNDDVSSRSAAPDSAINRYMKDATANGKLWLKSAADHLKANKETFTTWPGNTAACSVKISETSNTYGLI